MAEVKWIKIVTDIFYDEKILLIENMPEADSIIVIWFKLLCLAGKQNNGGVFMLNDKIAYTEEMLATVFRRPLNTVRLALKTFESYGMIEIVDKVVTIPNWEKHQSIDKLEQMREYNRLAQRRSRAKRKLLSCVNDSQSNVNDSHGTDKEEDKEVDKEVVVVSARARDEQPQQPDLPDISEEDDDMDYDDPESKLEPWGKDKVVYLTEGQAGDLLDKLGLQNFDYYIAKLSDFIVKKDANVQNHYKTILKWYKEDTRV